MSCTVHNLYTNELSTITNVYNCTIPTLRCTSMQNIMNNAHAKFWAALMHKNARRNAPKNWASSPMHNSETHKKHQHRYWHNALLKEKNCVKTLTKTGVFWRLIAATRSEEQRSSKKVRKCSFYCRFVCIAILRQSQLSGVTLSQFGVFLERNASEVMQVNGFYF